MKLLLVLMVCAVAAAAPSLNEVEPVQLAEIPSLEPDNTDERNILINALIRQLIAYVRRIINNGSDLFGIPPLDPLDLDHFHLVVPAGLINLDLDLKNIHVSGIGGFVTHRTDLNLRDLTFTIDISVPVLEIRAGSYNLDGDLFTAVPLYGNGDARFLVENFRFKAVLHLKQSDDGASILIDRIENPSFEIPVLKSELTGAIGGGDIDTIVNAMVEEVILDYINRFQGAISLLAGSVITDVLNPILDTLNTWHFISPLVPSQPAN